MKDNNPFAKLGALDQKLYQDTTPKPQPVQSTGKPAKHPTPEKKSPSPTIPSTKPPQSEDTKSNRATMPPRNQATMIPSNHDTTTPDNHDTVTPTDEAEFFEVVRKSVKQIGKEAATYRYTLEEKNAIEDIKYTYKRQGILTSANEITRIATNYFILDYRKNGERSLLAKVLKLLNS